VRELNGYVSKAADTNYADAMMGAQAKAPHWGVDCQACAQKRRRTC
jgi:hypothetical protein